MIVVCASWATHPVGGTDESKLHHLSATSIPYIKEATVGRGAPLGGAREMKAAASTAKTHGFMHWYIPLVVLPSAVPARPANGTSPAIRVKAPNVLDKNTDKVPPTAISTLTLFPAAVAMAVAVRRVVPLPSVGTTAPSTRTRMRGPTATADRTEAPI